MDPNFLDKPEVFWAGMEALGILMSDFILAITGWFVYRQLRTAARTFHFEGIRKMQEMIDEFREDRVRIYNTFPLEIVVMSKQFGKRPPGRLRTRRISEGERRSMLLTEEQIQAVKKLTDEQLNLAKRVIGKLNDLGQLTEDHLIDRRVFLGKYHTMVIRLCHFLEAVRRIEEEKQGGSYGQRLLRLRWDATRYNMIHPKHRVVEIKIVASNSSRVIVPAIEGTKSERLSWFIQRRFFP